MSFFSEANRDALSVSPTIYPVSSETGTYILIAVAVTIVVGMTAARAVAVTMRGPNGEVAKRQLAPLQSLAGLLASLAVVALLIMTVMETEWYWAALMVVAGAVVSGVAINGRNAAHFYKLSLYTNLLVVGATAILAWLLFS